MRIFIGLLVVAMAPIWASAEEGSSAQARADVLTCISGMDGSTTWGQCLEKLFAPCAEMEVGAEDQLACLITERENWRSDLSTAHTAVQERLTGTGSATLADIMYAWPKFVQDKCNAIAAARAEISRDAADLGCSITEIVLLTHEFTACADGRSQEEYCILQE